MIREFIIQALWISLELTAIPLGVAAFLGLIVAVLQAATSVQEQTTVYVVKLVGVVIAILLMLNSIENQFLEMMTKFGVILASGGAGLTW